MDSKWHHLNMRTTLAFEDDAMAAVQAYARTNRIPLGKAASELIRRGSRYQLGIRRIDGIPVFDAPDDFPVITTQQVRDLLDEE
jgi:hypothetical protein